MYVATRSDRSPTPRRSSTSPASNRSNHHSGVVAVVLATVAVVTLAAACSSTSTTDTAGSSATTSKPGATTPGTAPAATGPAIVFNGQGNNLDAYETTPPFKTQRVISTIADKPDGLDINAQICFFPDGSNRFIAGEDTNQGPTDLQGWGIFELKGKKVGDLSATQKAKLVPTYQDTPDNAENYGCGFLNDGRVVTTDVGNQALGPANGQLIVWFPPFDSEKVRYCKIDTQIATAQSLLVDKDDRVYVAAARPGSEPGDAGSGVWRYTGPFPTSDTPDGGCTKTDSTGAPMTDQVEREQFIKIGDGGMLSPTGLAWTANGGMYVSSVFTGVINEYDATGAYVRTVLKPAEGDKVDVGKSIATGTPLGIGVGPDGTIYFADIGIVISPTGDPGPGSRNGSVRRIVFKGGEPQPPETMATGLAFPDGIGVFVPTGS